MWIKTLQRRWRYNYYEEDVTFYNPSKGCDVTRTRRVWKSRQIWVEVDVWVGKRKYQKKPHHKKKELSEKQKAKKAWREHKHTKRDKAKRQDLHGYLSDGCPKWLKRHCNKKHRQWERRCIHHERYNKLGAKYKRKDFFDPWMWS